MGAVLWEIGKVAGLVVLVFLLLLLAVLFTVLLVPVRYRATVSVDGRVRASVRVTWLIRLISFHACYDGKGTFGLKVFGFPLAGEEKRKKKRRRKRKRRKKPRPEGGKPDPATRKPEEESPGSAANRPLPEPKAAGDLPGAERASDLPDPERAGNLSEPGPTDDLPGPERPGGLSVSESAGNLPGSEPTGGLSVPEPEKKGFPLRGPVKTGTGEPAWLRRAKNVLRKLWSALWKLGERVAKIGRAVRSVPAKVRGWKGRVLDAYLGLCERVRDLSDRKERLAEFLGDEENRRMLGLVRRKIGSVLRHVVPRKLEGTLRFGFDDPSVTGQVLMAVSPFYGFYAGSLTLIPMFDETGIHGEVSARGRIRMGTLLVIAVQVWRNRKFRILIQRLRGR